MQVRVATYNVKNLFAQRDIKQGGHTRPKKEKSIAALAESIESLEADVIAFQELSSQETLKKDLLSRLDLAKKYPHVAWAEGNDKRGIRVGIISKYPFTKVVTHADDQLPLVDGSGSINFSRDLLRVDVNTDADPEAELSVYTSHFKSRRPAKPGQIDSDLRRLSEATATRNIVESEMKEYPGRAFVVTGDFNDGHEDATVKAILNGDEAGDEKWVNSLDHLPDEERHTWPANPTHKRYPPVQFDHIIYPESMDEQVTRHQPERLGRSKYRDDIRWVSSTASDHLPVVVDVDIKD